MTNKDSNSKTGFTPEQYQQWAAESKANPLPRRQIDLAGKAVEVFALPGYETYAGRYVYSGTSATGAAEKPRNSMLRFLLSKSPLALPHKGFECYTFHVEGANKGIDGYPSPIIFDYWLYQLSNRNLTVLPLVSALGSTSLDLLADTEFDIDRINFEYRQLVRDRLYREIPDEYIVHFYPRYYEELYRIFQLKKGKSGTPGIFARATRECFYSLFPGEANDLFDVRNPERVFYNHQYLTQDGNTIFSQTMNSFLTFLRGCRPGDWDSFMVQYMNVYGAGFQQELRLWC